MQKGFAVAGRKIEVIGVGSDQKTVMFMLSLMVLSRSNELL